MANNGFFDSVNGDRVYSASDFGRMFEGLISDGIVRDWGNGMSVSQMMGATFILRSGRAYFNGCWLTSDDALTLDLTKLFLSLAFILLNIRNLIYINYKLLRIFNTQRSSSG